MVTFGGKLLFERLEWCGGVGWRGGFTPTVDGLRYTYEVARDGRA